MDFELQDKDCYFWKEILGAPDKSYSRQTRAEKRMNIYTSHASAWKGDLLIHAYCETRAELSPELSDEAIRFFDSLGPSSENVLHWFDSQA